MHYLKTNVVKIEPDSSPGKLTPLEAQKLVDLLNSTNCDANEAEITIEQARDILIHRISERIKGLTSGTTEKLIDIISKLPTKQFTKIVSSINMREIDEHTYEKDKILSLEKQKNFHRCLIVVKRKLVQGMTLNGWIQMDEFAIRSYNSIAITLLKIAEKLCKILDCPRDQLYGPNRIYDVENDEFLKTHDPNNEVMTFVKNITTAINNYNRIHKNKNEVVCFNDKSYFIFVIHRYPLDTKENIMINQVLIKEQEFTVFDKKNKKDKIVKRLAIT